MTKEILIANRGEIIIRIVRVCAEMGIRSVAAYSEVDRRVLHVRHANKAHNISVDLLVGCFNLHVLMNPVAENGHDVLHSDYGFLPENAELAEICVERGIKFIGPSAQVIRHMDDKTEAHHSMIAAGVSCTPGIGGNVADFVETLCETKWAGYPVMFKAALGGGGRGIRHCNSREELGQAFPQVISGATRALGSAEVFLEKCIVNPEHVEVQILVGSLGNTVHLFGRDCSTQRHSRKLIKIVPSPQLTPKRYAYVSDPVVRAVEAVGYGSTDTVKFLLADGEVYFMEMNVRVQVEYIIIEETTDIDVVCEQTRIAPGLELSVEQDDIVHHGYVLQFRINTKDPKNNFLPSFGKITRYYTPGNSGACIDTVIYTGCTIPLYYNSMCPRLIVWALTWEEAFNHGLRAPDDIRVQGIETIAPYYREILRSPEFRNGQFNTSFAESHPEPTRYSVKYSPSHLVIVVATAVVAYADL